MIRDESTLDPEGFGKVLEESRTIIWVEAKWGRVNKDRAVDKPKTPAPITRTEDGAVASAISSLPTETKYLLHVHTDRMGLIAEGMVVLKLSTIISVPTRSSSDQSSKAINPSY